INVVGQEPLGLTKIFDLRGLSLNAGSKHRIENQVGIGVRADGTDFHTHAPIVADGNANHGAAIDSGSYELVRRFKVGIETTIRVDARIQEHADVIAMGQNAIDKFPTQLAELLFTLFIPEEIFSLLADGDGG